jgi:hypothetical protein
MKKLLLVLVLIGCKTHPSAIHDLAMPDLIPPIARDKIDILFVADDSPGTSAKINALKQRFPELMKKLDALPSMGAASSIHIGVVTPDLGAGPSMATSNCKPGGLGGRLQPRGRAAPLTCQPPTGGKNFIEHDQIAGTDNLPSGQDLPTTFTCMATVGDIGCGFEHVLESPYKALHDDIPENAGFLRPDGILVVFWVTDEDDCSGPPDTDVFDPNATQYGPLLSFRCTKYGVMCGDPPMLPPDDSNGPLADCRGATADVGGKLYDVQRYIDFFTKPDGVKADPSSVIVGGINAPPMPFSTLLASPQNYQPCSGPVDGVRCAAVLGHSCNADADWFGDPGVRLSQVLQAVPNHLETSICAMDYTSAMQALGDAIIKLRLGN